MKYNKKELLFQKKNPPLKREDLNRLFYLFANIRL